MIKNELLVLRKHKAARGNKDQMRNLPLWSFSFSKHWDERKARKAVRIDRGKKKTKGLRQGEQQGIKARRTTRN